MTVIDTMRQLQVVLDLLIDRVTHFTLHSFLVLLAHDHPSDTVANKQARETQPKRVEPEGSTAHRIRSVLHILSDLPPMFDCVVF